MSESITKKKINSDTVSTQAENLPPLPVQNKPLWIITFMPILTALLIGAFLWVIDDFLFLCFIYDKLFLSIAVSCPVGLALSILLAYKDRSMLINGGHSIDKIAPPWYVPVYIFTRMHDTKHLYASLLWFLQFTTMLIFIGHNLFYLRLL